MLLSPHFSSKDILWWLRSLDLEIGHFLGCCLGICHGSRRLRWCWRLVLEAALHWETCRCVTRRMRQAVDLESPSWVLELMPPTEVLWFVRSLVVFPLLLAAPGLLPQSWGLLTPVCWLLLLFQLGCDRIHRLPNLVLAASGRR